MDITKENYFEVRYDTELDRLVLKEERLASKIARRLKEHKWITLASVAFVMFSCLNFAMIYNFMKILQSVR